MQHLATHMSEYTSRYAVLDVRQGTLSISARTILDHYPILDHAHGRIEYVTSIRAGPSGCAPSL